MSLFHKLDILMYFISLMYYRYKIIIKLYFPHTEYRLWKKKQKKSFQIIPINEI